MTRSSRVRITDVAAHAGVSSATVSFALNHPERVAPDTLQRVRASIQELGYVRNDAARQLRAGDSNTIGLILQDLQNPFFTAIARGVEDAAATKNYAILLGNSARDQQKEDTYLKILAEREVRAFVITPVNGHISPCLQDALRSSVPVVLVDSVGDCQGASCIQIDNVNGGRKAMRHLYDQGARRVLFVGPLWIPQVRDRYQGALEVARELPEMTLLLQEMPGIRLEEAQDLGRELPRSIRDNKVDAIFACNDVVAVGILQSFIQENGPKVPQDVLLVGFDDGPLAKISPVPLTSLRQPGESMGMQSLDLLGQIEKGGPAQKVVLEPALVVRASTDGRARN